jgi:hypothetical protein
MLLMISGGRGSKAGRDAIQRVKSLPARRHLFFTAARRAGEQNCGHGTGQ